MKAALAALADHDVVFVHVESPDEAGHAGDAAGKVKAIEQVDALMVPQILAAAGGRAAPPGRAPERLAAASGCWCCPTIPPRWRSGPTWPNRCPFVMWGPGFAANGAEAYTEKEARATGFAVAPGHLLDVDVPGLAARCRRRHAARGRSAAAAALQSGSLRHLLEFFLAGSAVGAFPVVGQVFERGPRRDALGGVADFGVVDVATQQALPLVHPVHPFSSS